MQISIISTFSSFCDANFLITKVKKNIKQRQIYLEYFVVAQVGLKGNETISVNLNIAGRQMEET
jgi:hypothetical protein